VSSSDTVLKPLNHENAYTNISPLPNTNPKCPQLVVLIPIVYFVKSGGENERGLNLNKCYPVQDKLVYLLDRTYAMGEAPELTINDLI
jgi:hypothetical protein